MNSGDYSPEGRFAASRPRVGDQITFQGVVTGKVCRVEGGICWNEYADGSGRQPFIWCFRRGLNELHDWPTKGATDAHCLAD